MKFKEGGISEWFLRVMGRIEFRREPDVRAHGGDGTQEYRGKMVEKEFVFRFLHVGRIHDSDSSRMAVLSGLKKIWKSKKSSRVRVQSCWTSLEEGSSYADLPNCGAKWIAQNEDC